MDVGNGSVNPLPGERLFDFEYVDDIGLLCDDTQTMKFSLDQLENSVRRYGIDFAPSKTMYFRKNVRTPNLHSLLMVS